MISIVLPTVIIAKFSLQKLSNAFYLLRADLKRILKFTDDELTLTVGLDFHSWHTVLTLYG